MNYNAHYYMDLIKSVKCFSSNLFCLAFFLAISSLSEFGDSGLSVLSDDSEDGLKIQSDAVNGKTNRPSHPPFHGKNTMISHYSYWSAGIVSKVLETSSRLNRIRL